MTPLSELDELTRELHADLVERSVSLGQAGTTAELRALTERARARLPLAPDAVARGVAVRVIHRFSGLGPLEPVLADEAASDVLVNADGSVWVERDGRLSFAGLVLQRAVVDDLVERIVATAGRRIDRAQPAVDARLADGSRVHAVIPPLSPDGPVVTIRRFPDHPLPLDALADASVVRLLRDSVADGRNMLIAGGTGSGKTTLLNALAAHVDHRERIVTIEDALELRLAAPHVVRLETRSEGREGQAAVTVRDLVRHALRMRPDRLVVGEVRGPEALDMVQAMLTGHDGCLTTVHAHDAASALRRVLTLCATAASGLPTHALMEQVVDAIDMVVVVSRTGGRARRVVEVAEVSGDRHRLGATRVALDGPRSAPLQRPARRSRWTGSSGG